MTERDDYLWDPEGAPDDPEIRRLEAALSEYRYAGSPPERARPPSRRWWTLAAVAAVAAGIAVGVVVFRGDDDAPGTPGPGWQYALVSDQSVSSGVLRVGEWLETKDGVAQVDVADIGRVTLDPQTRMRLVASGTDQHRVHLARGRMQAVVNAPPELFVTETPAATAVDMGCAYELEVDEAGDGFLRVTAGLVELRRSDRRSVVPAGALCEARGQGLGTPRFESATPPLRIALREIDFGDGGGEALGDVLDSATERDTLTLWHLLQHPRFGDVDRARILDVLESFTDMPIEATRDGTLALDPGMLDAWYTTLERYW